MCGLGAVVYFQTLGQIKSLLGQRAMNIAQTAAVLIDGDQHQYIVDNLADAGELSELAVLRKTLEKVKTVNKLQTDVYTMIEAPWIEKPTLVFVANSKPGPFEFRGIPYPPHLRSAFLEKKSGFTDIFEDIEGKWIAGYAPILTSNGTVSGVLEVALSTSGEVAEARDGLTNSILYSALATFPVTLILVWIMVWVSSRSISQLSSVVQEITKGNYGARASRSQGELGEIAHGFNELVDKLHDTMVSKEKLLAREAEIESIARFPNENPHPILRFSSAEGVVLYANAGSQDILDEWKCVVGTRVPEDIFKKTNLEFSSKAKFDIELMVGEKWYAFLFVNVTAADYVNVYGRDITEQRQSQAEKKAIQTQLIQASKLSSLGTMAAGVAHELNNPLTAIRGVAQILRNQNEKDSDKVDKIIHASTKMSKIIDHLRVFARENSREEWNNFSIEQPISESFILLEQQLKNHEIECSVSIAEGVADVWGDHNQMESVFQNLITNSRDAYQNLKDGRQRTIKIEVLQKGDQIEVVYTDNAGGMNAETISNLFEPFYTTKGEGVGTGLGMSISYGIIEQHGGKIYVSSEPGIGSSFKIVLPVSQNETVAAREAPVVELPRPAGEGNLPKLLVVDDQEDICFVLECCAEGHFSTTTFSDAVAALKDLESNRYDIVISDLRMPGCSGVEIVNKVKETSPETPVFIMSGHARTDADVSAALEAGAAGLITKPFESLEEVIAVLAGTLTRAA